MTLTSQFDFELPPALIAQSPVEPRDASRLLVCRAQGGLSRFSGDFLFEHKKFSDVTELLGPNDFLVLNDAKVLPVRLLGSRILEDGKAGGAVEAVLLVKHSDTEWNAILHLSAKVKPGMKLLFEPGLGAEILTSHEERLANHGEVRLRFSNAGLGHSTGLSQLNVEQWLEKHGHVPLPPYIERQETQADRKVYQTVYAQKSGSAAAPTAGFHFTPDLFLKLKKKGVQLGQVTLHVGLGTFRPIKSEHIEAHQMHRETFEISPEFAKAYAEARRQKKRIVAVGTTSVRALESWLVASNAMAAGVFQTQAYFTPGYQFKAVHDLITNFHLPKSTLLVLVAAAMGTENAQKAYQLAVQQQYRFFSYGDAMFIRGLEK